MRRQHILLTLAFALTIPGIAAALSLRDFEVAERFEGKPAEVNFQKGLGGTDPEVLRPFESQIREKASKGPDFAGHYTVTTFPCGTMCEGFAIVSAVDGSVYVPPEGSSMGLLFRRDANYLIVNPINESNEEEKELQDTNSIKTRFYRWDGQKLSEVTSATPELIAEAQKTALAQELDIAYDNALAAANRGDSATTLHKLRWAAERGHARSQTELGILYQRDDVVQQNYTEAVKWFRKAVDQGYATAQYALGHMYELGNGVEQDDKKAVQWYQKAADQGHAEAQNNLRRMYKGVEQKEVKRIGASKFCESQRSLFRLSVESGLPARIGVKKLRRVHSEMPTLPREMENFEYYTVQMAATLGEHPNIPGWMQMNVENSVIDTCYSRFGY